MALTTSAFVPVGHADVSLQLAASSRLIPYGRALTLSATLLDSSTSYPVPGETLQLQVRADSSDSWQVATDGVSNSARTSHLETQTATDEPVSSGCIRRNPSYGAARTRGRHRHFKPALQAQPGQELGQTGRNRPDSWTGQAGLPLGSGWFLNVGSMVTGPR